MEFTPRIRDILLLLLRAEQPLTHQEIADRLGVSKRTVQREFDYLESALGEYHLTLEKRKGAGLRLQGSDEEKDRLLELLRKGAVVGAEDKEERRRTILFTLLKDRTPKKLYYYSNMLGVSEATAASDMESLRPWLEHYRLHLVKRPGYGVTVDGAEEDFRQAMRRFISDNGTARLFSGQSAQAAGDAILSSIHQQSIYSLLRQDTVDRVWTILQQMEESRLQALADNAYMGLVIHIAIAVERIKNGGELTGSYDAAPDLEGNDEDFSLARRILSRMEDAFAIRMPEAEISYLMLHLKASKNAFTGSADGQVLSDIVDADTEKLMDLIDRMIELYNPQLSHEMKTDEDFLEGLIMHLRPVLVRLENHMDIYNPILEDIRKDYPSVFARCAQASTVLSEAVNAPISDEEVGYLAMHFGAAEERILQKQQTNRRVIIGVVCASGFGLARLMMVRIQDHLSEKVTLTSYGKEEITPEVIAKTDFFVSSFNLDDKGVDFIQVRPLITQTDISAIQAKVQEYAQFHRRFPEQDFLEKLTRIHFITGQMKNLLEQYHHYLVPDDISFRQLVRYMALQAAEGPGQAEQIAEGVMDREAVGSQVFPDLGLCLFHCCSSAVTDALFLSCTPEHARHAFTDPYLQGCRAAVLLFMPEDDNRKLYQELLGSISAAFVREDTFRRAFETGSEADSRLALMQALETCFHDMTER